ncbi:dihydrodipicolinate synthase family protein [Acuticoccus sp.]|uniref:dihydrodipicolinate synthase family protein n=1 Tax=Acuticoccus sp. TaxID=1904378 RepID=UPI003B519146
MNQPSRWRGVMPAVPVPVREDASPDLPAFGALLGSLSDERGITGFLVNGHAGENGTLPLADQVDVAREAVRVVAGRVPVVSGVNVASSAAATRHADALAEVGVDALMVFPPDGWALGAEHDAVLAHHAAIAAAGRDLLLFQASVKAGAMAYGPRTLAALATMPGVVAVKEGSWEVAAYEANRRLVREVAPHVAVMGSGDEHLFTSAVVGSEGAIVSLAAVVPAPIVALLDAVERGDLAAARAAHERIYPLALAVYGVPPGGRATQRLKTLLRVQGRFASDRMVPPAQPTPAKEHGRLEDALRHASSA